MSDVSASWFDSQYDPAIAAAIVAIATLSWCPCGGAKKLARGRWSPVRALEPSEP